jgi:hypothetical protein
MTPSPIFFCNIVCNYPTSSSGTPGGVTIAHTAAAPPGTASLGQSQIHAASGVPRMAAGASSHIMDASIDAITAAASPVRAVTSETSAGIVVREATNPEDPDADGAAPAPGAFRCLISGDMHEDIVLSVALDGVGSVVSASRDGAIRLWDMRTREVGTIAYDRGIQCLHLDGGVSVGVGEKKKKKKKKKNLTRISTTTPTKIHTYPHTHTYTPKRSTCTLAGAMR